MNILQHTENYVFPVMAAKIWPEQKMLKGAKIAPDCFPLFTSY